MSENNWIPFVMKDITDEEMAQLANASRSTTQLVWDKGAKVDLNEQDLERLEKLLKPLKDTVWKHTRTHLGEHVGPYAVVGNSMKAYHAANLLANLQPNVLLELINLARQRLRDQSASPDI